MRDGRLAGMHTHASMATFERIAESIRDDIRSGQLQPGDKLPPHRELAAKYNVAVATLQNALRKLQDEGWLTARASVGVFVNTPPPEDPANEISDVSRQVSELRTVVADLVRRVESIERGHGEA